MANIIPFESKNLPAHIAGFAVGNDLTANVGTSFPIVSIKGKVFHVSRGDDRTMVTDPNEPGQPARYLDVVILKANPNLSKIFFEGGYEEGSTTKPTCYSNDSTAPAGDAQSPQSKTCATCVHNQWGSRITDNGGKGKACADLRRVAIAPGDQLNDPMLLRVPAASLKTLRVYGEELQRRNVPYCAVVTRIGFDYAVAHPALTFKPIGFIDADAAAQVKEVLDSDVIKSVIGTNTSYAHELVDNAPATQAPAAPAAPAKAQEQMAEVEKKAAAAPKAKVKTEAPNEVVVSDDMASQINNLLGGFDDQ